VIDNKIMRVESTRMRVIENNKTMRVLDLSIFYLYGTHQARFVARQRRSYLAHFKSIHPTNTKDVFFVKFF
jgi:hypothetical protein